MLGDLDAAISCWGQAVEIEPGHKFALYNLGTAYLDKGDKAKARTYLDQVQGALLQGPAAPGEGLARRPPRKVPLRLFFEAVLC